MSGRLADDRRSLDVDGILDEPRETAMAVRRARAHLPAIGPREDARAESAPAADALSPRGTWSPTPLEPRPHGNARELEPTHQIAPCGVPAPSSRLGRRAAASVPVRNGCCVGEPSMWLEAIPSRDDLEMLAEELLPLRLHLGERATAD